ncbi:unnamed protein product [Cylindrotheca closterium]|uniref:Uncharacterized protein n=1 Tax=Cylindrotheca closterium TaxID=2856 RepID=A0AAD2CK01_9STRA|nr:unnamed protein product [Cylindrotheca closterium]
MVKFKFFSKKKSKKNLLKDEPTKSSEPLPKPPAPALPTIPQQQQEDESIQENGSISNGVTPITKRSTASSIISHHSTTNKDELLFQDDTKDEADEHTHEDEHHEENQGVFAALCDDEYDSASQDFQENNDSHTDEEIDNREELDQDEGFHQEEKEEGDEHGIIFAASGDGENGAAAASATDINMSAEAAAGYYDYGDAAPSIPQDYKQDEIGMPTGEAVTSHGASDMDDSGPIADNVAAYYGYGDAAPSAAYREDESPVGTDAYDAPDTISANLYGYEDAAPDINALNLLSDSHEDNEALQIEAQPGDESNESSFEPTLDDPKSKASLQPALDDPVKQNGEEEMSQAAKLYLAKRHRLKQRRMSMTPTEQRTERAAARRNKLLLKKLLKKEMSEEDDYIQTHLGCDDKGMCLRHPNMIIVGKVNEFRFKSIFSCKICASEQKAGGHARQRKSMCMVIGDIKSLQKDRRSWRKRTQVMHHGKEYDSDEDDSYDEGKQSDSSNSLDSIEKITGFFAEGTDADDLSKQDDVWKEKVAGRVAQVRAWDGKAALKCNPVFAKYFRMVSLGVPPDAVKQSCEFDGWDPRVMDLDPNRPLRDQLYSDRTWKKSEKEDLLLNIRLCMGQESAQEDTGNGLVETVDNVFQAYCKKKESIELHRIEVKKQEEAQKWIGSGQSLLKRTTAKTAKPVKPQVNQTLEIMKDIEESFAKGVDPEPQGAEPAELSSSSVEKSEELNTEHPAKDGTEPETVETRSILSSEFNQSLASIGEIPEGELESDGDSSSENEKVSHSDSGTKSPVVDEAETHAEETMKNASALANIMKGSLNEEKSEEQPPSDELDPTQSDPGSKPAIPSPDPIEQAENKSAWSDDEEIDLPLNDDDFAGNKRKEQPPRQLSIDSEAMYSVADDGGGDSDEGDDIEDGKDTQPSRQLSIDSAAMYSVADDGVGNSEEGDAKEDILYAAFESNQRYSVIDEIFDDWDEPLGIPNSDETGQAPEIDDVSVGSNMTGDTGKLLKRSSKRISRQNKIRDIEKAHRMLEAKDIIVASLVSKIERLQEELARQRIIGGNGEKYVAELRETKRLMAEKEVIAVSVEKQIKRQECEANEKWHAIEEQTLQIMRLKEKLASQEKDSGKGQRSSKVKRQSSSRKSKTSEASDYAQKKSSSSSTKKKSSSSKDKKKSSKGRKSRSKSKSSKKSKRKDNLDRDHLRAVFKNFVRKLIIITRSFDQNFHVDKEMSVDRKSFRRSSMRMDAWVAPTEWNDFLSDDEEDLDSKPPRPPPTSSTSSSPSPYATFQKIRWADDDNICKVAFVERIQDDLKKDLFYNGEDINRFRLDKFMEDHEDEFELVEEDDSDYSEEWVEEEFSGEEEEIEYYDEEVVSDDEASYEEEIVTDDNYSIVEIPAQQNRRRSLF